MDRVDIIKTYKNGVSATEILKKTKYKSSTSIYNILEGAGIKRRNKEECQKSIEIPKNKLEQLYFEENKTLDEIGNMFSCDAETIRRLFIKYDVERKDKTRNFAGWNKGKKMSKKQRKNLSLKRKNMYENGKLKHWNKGNNWSEKVKEKISISLKGRFRGKENVNWKGGVSTKNQRIRQRVMGSYQYKKWRKNVYKRDNYTCQLCGEESEGDLEGHHIIPVSGNYNLIFDVENGITLCRDCHREIRHKEDEYIDFFKNKIKEKKNEKRI